MTGPHDALPLLIGVEVEPERVTFTAQGADFEQVLTLPRPLYFDRMPQLPAPDVLAVSLDPRASEPVAWYAVEPYTPEGQAALVALGYAGPFPVPEGVTLGGYGHGAALSEAEAMCLAGLPDFVERWLICPDGAGGLTLLWGDSATTEQLERSSAWAELTTAALQAEGSARGSA